MELDDTTPVVLEAERIQMDAWLDANGRSGDPVRDVLRYAFGYAMQWPSVSEFTEYRRSGGKR